MADGTYQPKVYREQGGDRQVIASGGSFDVESGGEIDVESGGSLKLAGTAVSATALELNLTDNMPADITFAAAAAASNVCEVTCTVKDAAGATIAGVFHYDIWLSDAATGEGITATAASGTVTNKAASGYVVTTWTAKKAMKVQTLATGIFILQITDSGKTAFYVAAQSPGTGATKISSVLVTGDYGA